MTVVVTGRDLTREALVRVARDGELVALDDAAVARMRETRAILDHALAEARPSTARAPRSASSSGSRLRATTRRPTRAGSSAPTRSGRGPAAAPDVVRGTMLRLANAFAEGSPGARGVLAERLVEALNAGETPRVRTLGSLGQADLAQMADLGLAVFADIPLEAGEGLAILGSNAFATAAAALAIADQSGSS